MNQITNYVSALDEAVIERVSHSIRNTIGPDSLIACAAIIAFLEAAVERGEAQIETVVTTRGPQPRLIIYLNKEK